MDFNFLSAANSITNKYFGQEQALKGASGVDSLSEEAKKKFGEEFGQAYDSMMASRMVNSTMRQSYEMTHQDDFRTHANRLGYSIDNRVIDMLGLQLSDEMNEKVNAAMNNAMNSL